MADAPKQKFFYKQVALLSGRYFSLSDRQTEFVIGETMHDEGKAGGYSVYRTPEEALFSGPQTRDPELASAPKTVLRVMAWGDCTEHSGGRLSYPFLCPVFNVGLPRGYMGSREAQQRGTKRLASRIKQPSPGTRRLMDLPYWEKLAPPVSTRAVPATKLKRDRAIVSVKRSLESPAVIIKSARNYRVSQSVPRRPRKVSPMNYRAKLERMQNDAKSLEKEVEEMEKKAAQLKLDEDFDVTDSMDITKADP